MPARTPPNRSGRGFLLRRSGFVFKRLAKYLPALTWTPGESQAIALAEELHADRILLDDFKARRIAVARGLNVAGTLAVLIEAHRQGLLDLRRTVDELRETTFYVDQDLLDAILQRVEKP